MQLRDYQARSVDQLFDWLSHNTGHPCLEIPTGGGKTLIASEICKRSLAYTGTRVLVLSHVKELLQQLHGTLVRHWPNAPVGVYSAGLNQRTFGQPITIAGIQSLRNKFHLLGDVHIVIVDECHLISHKEQGLYRELIDHLTASNPKLRVIGLTATPYRLGHGLITDDPALFTEILRPTSIEELIHKGYLAPLRSKMTGLHYDLTAVHKRGGEYVESELSAAVDTDAQNDAVAAEIVKWAGDRKAWLVFCTSILHALHMRDSFSALGISAEVVTGETAPAKRDDILRRFKSGEIRCICNVSVLTTGFDYPDIDLVAMCRPTLSPGLYSQCAGRGLRLKSHTDHCLFLDFAGVVELHGPITAIRTPEVIGEGSGEAPIKVCDACHELVHASAKVCPACGAEFESSPPPPLILHDDDVMEMEVRTMDVKSWSWCEHTSNNSGKTMLRVSFFSDDLDSPLLQEYLCLRHIGYARQKAERELFEYERRTGLPDLPPDAELPALAKLLNGAAPPQSVTYKRDGQWWRIIDKVWGEPRTPESLDELLDYDDIPF